MSALRLTLQILVPVAVLAGGGWGAYAIFNAKKKPIVQAPANRGPLVRTATIASSNEQLDVLARGSVEALRTVDLASEVGGKIVASHEALRVGGTFTPNDVLLEIDTTDYKLRITQQEAAVARAELRLTQEKAEAEAAIRAWKQIEGDKPADPLVRREPQIRDAKLAVDAANAQLTSAKNDLLRCKVQLPFGGRVRSVHADIGQTVQRGQRLAVVLDTTQLEVRLPIALQETAFVDLPLTGQVDDGPKVTFTAEFAGAQRTWHGSIVRVEGEIDRRTRQLTAIAQVGNKAGDTPLLVGMFVGASITGRTVQNVFKVPSTAMHSGNHVWVVEPFAPEGGDQSDSSESTTYRLRDREVEVLRTERTHSILKGGVAVGEHICLTNLQAPIDGMTVRIRPPEPSGQAPSDAGTTQADNAAPEAKK